MDVRFWPKADYGYVHASPPVHRSYLTIGVINRSGLCIKSDKVTLNPCSALGEFMELLLLLAKAPLALVFAVLKAIKWIGTQGLSG